MRSDDKVNLVDDTIDNKDIDALIEWLKGYPRLTKGPQTIEFEKAWANWIGTKESIFVNSGSSANLVMLQALLEMGWIKKGDVVRLELERRGVLENKIV